MKSPASPAALVLALLLAAPALGAEPPAQAKPAQGQATPAPKPGAPAAQKPVSPAETNKALYGVGLVVARDLRIFSLTPAELDTVIRGIRDGLGGKAKEQLDPAMQTAINDLARERAPKAAEKAAAQQKSLAAPYLAKMEKEKGAKKLPSGVIVIPVAEGTGASPKATDKVKVNYTGRLVNGEIFDSTAGRGPAEFPLSGVIKCWTEGLQQMKVGGKAKLVCPPDTAYGDRGSPPAVPGSAVLTFDVELLDIVK